MEQQGERCVHCGHAISSLLHKRGNCKVKPQRTVKLTALMAWAAGTRPPQTKDLYGGTK